MPDLQEILNSKSDRLTEIPEVFIKQTQKLEPAIMREIEDLVSKLEMENGNIVLSERNMVLVENVNQRMKNLIFNEEYEKNLTGYISEFGKQAGLNNEYFQVTTPGFQVTPLYETVLRSTQRNAIDLLGEDAFTQVLIGPIKQTLEASVTNNISFTETMTNLRYLIEGDEEVDGRLISHIKRVAYDSFAVSDRSYTNTIATDLGLEFYRYSGGKIEETRCFCEQRAGKFFHKKEIELWGEGKNLGVCDTGGGKWAGMNYNTDKGTIFFYAGGYSCKHSILPVSKKSVPSDVIQRAIKAGYYKPKVAA
jgi:hypothetical protein